MDDGGGDYNYFVIEFRSIEATFRPTRRDQLLRLRFNFSLNFETTDWILNQNSETLEFTPECLSSKHNPYATVIVGESLSLDGAHEAVGEAVGGLMTDSERGLFVPIAMECALGQVHEKIPAAGKPHYGTLYLDFKVIIERRSQMLESCCICLEELFGDGGGRVLRMPCSHFFHGGCIDCWLKSSRSCPLCRCEMPNIPNFT